MFLFSLKKSKRKEKKTSMKNKFKKSKIIVPALALITATTVASVTGTVAWFTASRVAIVNASTFETKALDTNLLVKSSKLVGVTSSESSATASSTVTVDGAMTHGSYNAQASNGTYSGELYVANIDEDSTVSSFSSHGTLAVAQNNAVNPTVETHSTWWAGSYTEGGSSKNIWYGVAWQMDFSSVHSADDTLSLFVDYKNTTFTDNKEGGTTMPGLRIALMTGSTVRVLGGESSETNHVTGTQSTNVNTFTSGVYNYVGSSSKYTKAVDKTDFSTNVGLLGAMTVDTSKTSSKLSVTAVAWYEGESTAIVKDATMSQVSATLSFYTRVNKANA